MVGNLLQYRGADATRLDLRLVDEFVQASDSWSFQFADPANTYLSQSWQSGADPNELTEIYFRLRRIGSPGGTLRASVYAHAGTYGTSSEPSGTPLAVSETVDASALTTSYSDQAFSISGWTPAASTNYTVVIDGSALTGLISSTNDILAIYEPTPNNTHSGNMARSADGTTWSIVGGGAFDLAFKVYESTPGVLDGEFVQLSDNLAYSFPDGNGTSDWSRVGQGYTFGPEPSEIRGIGFRLRRNGTATGMLNALITGSSLTDIQVRSSTFVAADSISTSPTDYFFDLSGWTPTASTLYNIMLETTDGLIDASNTIDLIVESGADATAPHGLRAYQYPGTQSSIAYDLAYKVYSVSGSAPSYTEDPVTSIDSGSLASVTISNVLSTDETNALKIDVSQLEPEPGTGRPVREVYIERIKAITSGVDVDILWDATSPEHCLSLSGNSGIDWDFRAVGPLTNNAGAGKTGNILFSTNGATAGSSYSVTLTMRKKY